MKKLLLFGFLFLSFLCFSCVIVVEEEPLPPEVIYTTGPTEVYEMTAHYEADGDCYGVSYPYGNPTPTVWVPAGTPLEDYPNPHPCGCKTTERFYRQR